MKKTLRIYIYLLILTIIPIIYLLPNITPKSKIKFYTPPLGNILSAFFYYTNTNFADTDQIDTYKNHFNKMSKSDLKSFFLHLPWDEKKVQLHNYITRDDATWSSLDSTGADKKNYLYYWQTIRPIMREFYAEHLMPINVTVPVVHFRCSDSPFNRNVQYHLTKSSSVSWIADQIKQRGFKNIILLSCSSHHTMDKKSCAKYTKEYAQLFSKQGLQVSVQCNSVLHDFSMMVNSPLLISLNASSYSFMAGVAKNPKDYISCNMGIEINGKYHLQTQADWILDPNPPLLHSEVQDYSDTKTVTQKL